MGDRGDLAELVAGIVVHWDRLITRLKSENADEASDRPDDRSLSVPWHKPQKISRLLSSCTLQPEDWADIALKIADRYGPPADADFEEQFSTLRRNILEQAAAEVDIMAR
jgi:hypothetical protein